jgi:acyl-[acyl-carrier-protein]-phospholipid O-acyltransferase/long-chain-fatty-acid--[acyl-carrier-protein] ligase
MQPNPWAGLSHGFSRLRRDRTLALAVLGVAYFWFLGALLQLLILLVGKHTMALDDVRIAVMGAWLAVGIGAGSLAAGRLSGQKVELGLAPVGAFGMGACAIALSLAVPSYAAVCATVGLLGLFGGLFIVPLQALMQQRPAAGEKGQVIATGNLLSTGGVLLGSAVLLLGSTLQLSPERMILALGLMTLAASAYVLVLVPDYFIRFALWTLTHTVYRIRIVGQEHVPFRGPALLVCNHLSHVDGFLVGASVQRFVRFMIYRPYYEFPLFKPLLRRMHAIPVAGGNRQEVAASIARAREELESGHVVCIFAEGAISRTGNLLPFKRGFERIVGGLDVPVIPVNLDRVWGSIFSFKGGRFVWKWPTRLPYPVTVTFGPPLPGSVTAAEARQAVMSLGTDALSHRFGAHDVLHERFLRTAKRRWRALAMADATGLELT